MLRSILLALALSAVAACKPATPEHEPLAPRHEAVVGAPQAGEAIRAADTSGPKRGECSSRNCVQASPGQAAELAEAFTQALDGGDDAPALQQAQRRWAARKLACRAATNPAECVAQADRTRIAELREISANAPRLVDYACEGSELPFTARFRDGDPPTAVFMLGGDRVEIPAAVSGSGARYAGDGVEYWEHHGEAMVDFQGTKLSCRPLG